MASLHDDGQAVWLGALLDQVGQLHHGLFLNLGAAHDPFGQPGVLGQANYIGVLVGHDANPQFANNRAEMVAAGTAHGNGTHDHELIEVADVGKLRQRRCGHVTTTEHLIEVHLRHPARSALRVVVVGGIDDQAVEHPLHLGLHLVEQRSHFVGRDEFGNVVVGMEALARCQQAFADFYRYRQALFGVAWVHGGLGLHQHGKMVPAFRQKGFSRLAPVK